MDNIDLLNKLIEEVDQEYLQKMISVLDVVTPELDTKLKNSIAHKICFNRVFMDPTEIILMCYGRAFDNPALRTILTDRILKTAENNKGLKPCIDDTQYWCETCGSHSHQEHPKTGYCFHCNTDNWEPENFRNI